MQIELKPSMQNALELLATAQARNVRTQEEMAFDFLFSTTLSRTISKSKGAEKDAAKRYEAAAEIAKSMGVTLPVSKSAFIAKEVVKWNDAVAALEADKPTEEISE